MFKVNYKRVKCIDLALLRSIQRANAIILPSDLVYLYINNDGVEFNSGYSISLDKTQPLVEINRIFDLEWLMKEREYDKNDDSVTNYTGDYIKIAETFSQDRVLMGINENNQNQVFLYSYDEDEIVRICGSLTEFINEHLISEE